MRITIIALAAGFSIVGSVAAADAQAAMRQPTHIQAQPLDRALQSLANARGLAMVYRAELVAELNAPGVEGELTLDETLKQLLSGTNLTYKLLDDSTVTIMPLATAPAVQGLREMAPQNAGSVESSRSPQDQQKAAVAVGEPRSFWQRLRLAQAEGDAAAKPASTGEQAPAEVLEEITVTAQKRQELLINVPISMTVLRGEDLDRFTGNGVSEALTLVPGVKFTEGFQGAGSQLSMRGVSASGPLFNGSSPIAYYLDGVPFGLVKTALLPDSNPYDLDHIEALRGPQSTLYGASALNGVVRVLTHDADLNTFRFKARTSVSSTDEGDQSHRADMAVNVPLVPGKLAARAVIGYNDQGGWIDSLDKPDANGTDLRSGRLKINAQPTDKLSIGLSAWFTHDNYGAADISDNDNVFPSDVDQPVALDYDVYGLKVGYDFGGFALSSVTSHIDYQNHSVFDLTPFGLFPFFTELQSEVLSQELVFTSDSQGAWRWSMGAFYRDAEDRLLEFPAPTDFSDFSESFAVFGELTRVFADGRFELTGGARYFEDRVTQRENKQSTAGPPRDLIEETRTFNNVSPRVVLNWHPNDRGTVYVSYSEGFRSGFNQNANVVSAVPGIPPADEDTLKNYEVGAKGSLFGGLLEYDTSAYFIDWQDVQQTLGVFIGSGIFTAVVNGESASGPGFDLALTTRPLDGLELGASFSWNDLTLDKQVLAPVPNNAPPPDFVDIVLFEKGDRLNYSAKTTVGASADYVFPLGTAGFEGRISASAQYSSSQSNRQTSGSSIGINVGDDILTARTSFSYGLADHWLATLFVDNVNNERGSPSPFGADFFSSRIRPRTYGLQFEYHFDK